MDLRFRAVLSDMKQFSTQLRKETENYSYAFRKTKDAADRLTAGWEGDARNAFVKEQENAFQYYNEMIRLVREHADKIQKATREYADTDARGAQKLRAL